MKVVLTGNVVVVQFLKMARIVEGEQEFWFFVFVDVDSGHQMSPFAIDVVEATYFTTTLVDQIELVAVADAYLVIRLAPGRKAIGRVDQRNHNWRFAQLKFP